MTTTHDWRDQLRARLAPLRLRPEREIDIVDELAQHLDDQIREHVSAGVGRDIAIRDALAELDAPGVLARRIGLIESRALDTLPPGAPARGRWLVARWQDLKYAVRSLTRTPAFTLTVVATMALTIGPTTAMVSIGNWLIWHPVPVVTAPEQLSVVTFATFRDDGYSPRRIPRMTIDDLIKASTTMVAMSGTTQAGTSAAVDGRIAETVTAAPSDASLFDTLGIRAQAGRFFTAGEDVLPWGVLVAVVSDGFARNSFGAPAAAVGKHVTVNGRRLEIVGVAPRGFRGIEPMSAVDIWFPGAANRYISHISTTLADSRADGAFYEFVIRRRPGVSNAQVQAELDVLTTSLFEKDPAQFGQFKTARGRVLDGLAGDQFSRTRNSAMIRRLLAIGAVLVVLGCANVANLLIFRGFRRGREQALRLALGAGRGRLLQAQLTESCVLTMSGAALGLLLAAATQQLMLTWITPAAATVEPEIPIDARVLAITLAISIGAGILAGFLPAWLSIGRLELTSMAAHAGSRVALPGRRLRGAFASLQLGLSLAMLIGALLMVTTVRHLLGVGLGFDPTGVSVHMVRFRGQGYTPARSLQYMQDLEARLATTPGIRGVTFANSYPLTPNWRQRVRGPGDGPGAVFEVAGNGIGPQFFDVLGIPLLSGRTFTPTETYGTAPLTDRPVVISRTLAQRLFGTDQAVGRAIEIPSGKTTSIATVVGVAGDVVGNLVSGEQELSFYEPLRQLELTLSTAQILLKSAGSATEATTTLRRVAAQVDAAMPIAVNTSFQATIDRRLVDQRLFARVLSLLGGLGFVLAAVGLYGLLAQTVSERTREFGIRMAIGASRQQVFALVLRYAMVIAVVGSATGIALAVFGTRLIQSQLFGVTALDPAIYGTACIALLIVVFAAAAWPARAATKVQPTEALRE